MSNLVEVFFRPVPSRGIALFLLAATTVYLLIELGFNARLLDVAGAPSSSSALLGIEQWGRLISGFAVALAFWGFLFKIADDQGWETGTTVGWFVGFTTIIMVSVYWLETTIIDSQVKAATAQERQLGAIGVLLGEYVHENHNLEGIPLDEEVLATPEGKAFFALFADNYSAVLRSDGGVEPVIRSAIEGVLIARVGSEDETYNSIYRSAIDELHRAYREDYLSARNRYAETINGVDARLDEAWQRYENELARRNWTPTTVPQNRYRDVERNVRSQLGVNVPEGWLPYDRYTFQSILMEDIYQRADAEWDRRSRELFDGEPLPWTLTTFDAFVAHPVIQRTLREELETSIKRESSGRAELPELRQPIADGWTTGAWAARVYDPMLQQSVEREYQQLARDTATYAEGGVNYCRGVNAVYALRVPSFALSLSIAGAIYHSSKVIWYLFYLIPGFGSLWVRWPVRLAFIGALITLPMGARTGVLASERYDDLMAYKEQIDGMRAAFVNDWIIRAQQLYYPIASGVRGSVLLNADFGSVPLLPQHECSGEE